MLKNGAGTSVPSEHNETHNNGTKVPTPVGYKQTKVGVIPEEWEVVRLGDVAPNISYGLTVRPEYIENGIPLISATEIKRGIIDYTNAPNISEDDFNKLSQKAKAKKGDIFLSKTGTIGRVAYVYTDKIIAITQNIAIIRVDNKKYSHEFLLQYLITDTFQKSAIKKVNQSTIMDLQLQDIKKLIIPLPPLKEQQKIAQILSTWDSAIAKQETLIKAKEQLKKGLMQKLLSGEVRFEEFDEEWEEVRLGDIGEIITGVTPPTKEKEYYDNGSYPWITPTDIDSKRDIYKSERYLSQKGLNKGRFVPKGSLLVTCIASIGKNAILSVDGSCNQQINAILPSDKNNIEFLYYVMEYYSEYLLKFAGKSATPILNKKSFRNLKFTFPPLKEQQKIAQVLTTADEEIELLKNELETLKEQKRGLMQRLLSGDVRVVV